MEYIEKAILNVFKKQKVSLSQVRVIFNHLLRKIEDKNIINLCGKPLMWYTIQAAKESGKFEWLLRFD